MLWRCLCSLLANERPLFREQRTHKCQPFVLLHGRFSDWFVRLLLQLYYCKNCCSCAFHAANIIPDDVPIRIVLTLRVNTHIWWCLVLTLPKYVRRVFRRELSCRISYAIISAWPSAISQRWLTLPRLVHTESNSRCKTIDPFRFSSFCFYFTVSFDLCAVFCAVQLGLPRTVATRPVTWSTRRWRRQWRRRSGNRWRQGERRGRRRPVHLTVRDGPKGQRRFKEDQSFVLALLNEEPIAF